MYMNILENIICIVYDDVFFIICIFIKAEGVKDKSDRQIRRH